MLYCKNCGAKLEEDAKYCSKCGTKIDPIQENDDSKSDKQIEYINVDCMGIGKIPVEKNPKKTNSNKRPSIQIAAIVFLVMDCVLNFIIGIYIWGLLFRLLFIIPCTVYYCYKTGLNEKVNVGFKIFVLILLGFVPSLLMLLDDSND